MTFFFLNDLQLVQFHTVVTNSNLLQSHNKQNKKHSLKSQTCFKLIPTYYLSGLIMKKILPTKAQITKNRINPRFPDQVL